jgi:phenylalanyl-tRNA synthetase beta chain
MKHYQIDPWSLAMKIPLKWLADYVSIDLPVAELVQRLTLAGLEVSGVRMIGLPIPPGLRVKPEDQGPVWDREKIVIARVIEVKPHPDADRLKLPIVDYGQGRTKQLVTGATNLKVGDNGQKVILALCGSILFDGHATPKKLAELKPIKMRGIPSDAMVCSALELGISDEHEGIILLEDDAPIGTPLVDFMGDIVVEIDVLPNMARCLSLVGVAREVAAITGGAMKQPPSTVNATGLAIAGRANVRIVNSALSPRYAAGLIEGVKIGPAPGWMQRRLTYAGMRPISNIVDITNYVMLEWGQPLHAFDYDILKQRAGGKAPTIIVRPAAEGEILMTLDGEERKLTPDMLVIADERGAIALAGVMGGADTEVSAKTTNILLESANFDFISIRRTMRALDLPSEASMRFSRGIHPELVPIALARASELMRLHAGGTVAAGILDEYPAPPAARTVELKMSEVRRLLGVDIPIDEASRVLRTLEFGVEVIGGDTIKAAVPPHRLDVQEGPADLIEDLARLHGYDRLPATLLSDQLPPQENNESLLFEEKVRDRLVALGLQEIITYSLTTPQREAPLHLAQCEYVTLINPISSERVAMRHSMLTGALEAAASNLRETDIVRLFEIGSVYPPRAGRQLPDEPRRLGVVLCGKRKPEFWEEGSQTPSPMLDFFDLKGVIEALVSDLHLAATDFRSVKAPALHPGKGAEIAAGDQILGTLGELHPKVAEAFGLAGRSVLVAELDLEAVRAALPARYAYSPVPRFPAALRDIAVIVEGNIPAECVETEIRAGGGALLRHVRLFDLYTGDRIPSGTKSLAYALTYIAEDRTLTEKEIERAHKSVENRLRHVLKAQIRGQDV